MCCDDDPIQFFALTDCLAAQSYHLCCPALPCLELSEVPDIGSAHIGVHTYKDHVESLMCSSSLPSRASAMSSWQILMLIPFV